MLLGLQINIAKLMNKFAMENTFLSIEKSLEFVGNSSHY